MTTESPIAPAVKTKAAPFKPNAAQTSILKTLSAGATSDFKALIAGGGNGMTIAKLAELSFVKITAPTAKSPKKIYSLTAAGRKLVTKLS